MNGTTVTDVAIVGGGVAGASLGTALARAGLGVTIIEREARFRDRVRGEAVMPWGVHEATQLDLLPALREAGAHETKSWQVYDKGDAAGRLDLMSVTPFGHGVWNVYHPSLQNALLNQAVQSGATILRPARTLGFKRQTRPELTVRSDTGESTIRARLIVGADGRQSGARRWAGVETVRDPVRYQIGGCLLKGVSFNDTCVQGTSQDCVYGLVLPQKDGRARGYIACHDDVARNLIGAANRDQFIPTLASTLTDGILTGVEPAGPIAFFPNADIWSHQAAANGVALIGDAAGANDPIIGQGLSLCFRDARQLRDLLLDDANWNRASAEYAKRRAGYFDVVRTYARWYSHLRLDRGLNADARRAQVKRAREVNPASGEIMALPLKGPDGVTLDEAARRSFFGEDIVA